MPPNPPKGKQAPPTMPLRPPEVPLKEQLRALTKAKEEEVKAAEAGKLRIYPNSLQFEQLRAYYADMEKANTDAENMKKQAERALLANLSGIYAAAGIDMQEYEHVTVNLIRADKAYLEYKVRETPPETPPVPEKKDGEGDPQGSQPSEPASTPPTAEATPEGSGAPASEGVPDGSA